MHLVAYLFIMLDTKNLLSEVNALHQATQCKLHSLTQTAM